MTRDQFPGFDSAVAENMTARRALGLVELEAPPALGTAPSRLLEGPPLVRAFSTNGLEIAYGDQVVRIAIELEGRKK